RYASEIGDPFTHLALLEIGAVRILRDLHPISVASSPGDIGLALLRRIILSWKGFKSGKSNNSQVVASAAWPVASLIEIVLRTFPFI
ncbi:MAG: hypothetical protein WA207_20210, partial [Candidatus Acidiferrum sp.]